jgi:hypothetical protein
LIRYEVAAIVIIIVINGISQAIMLRLNCPVMTTPSALHAMPYTRRVATNRIRGCLAAKHLLANTGQQPFIAPGFRAVHPALNFLQ